MAGSLLDGRRAAIGLWTAVGVVLSCYIAMRALPEYYSANALLFLLGAAYVLFWFGYFVYSPRSFPDKTKNCILSSMTMFMMLGLLELPVVLGGADYRLILSGGAGLLYDTSSPQTNPTYRLDRELIYVRRPHQRIIASTAGDLVYWLGIPTTRRYQADVQYDSRGFRNHRELERAAVVLIGDSFIEGALVAQNKLVSALLQESLSVDVANLGQTGYGPQQELAVLRRYALNLHPRIVVWFFFEGNDLVDVQRYGRFVQNWDAIENEMYGFKRRSFVRNAFLIVEGTLGNGANPWRKDGEARRRSCVFARSRAKNDRTIYFAYAAAPLSEKDRAALETAKGILLQAQRLSLQAGARFLFVYIPTKFRVYKDLCDFPEDGYGRQWQPNDLPDLWKAWLKAEEIAYLDLTDALKAAAADGELVYFADDGHFNAAGQRVAAESIGRFIRDNRWL